MKSESKSTKDYCDFIKADGGVILVFSASLRQTCGIPDRYIAHRKYCGFAEMKKGDAKLRTDQYLILKSLRERGANAVVIRFYDTEIIWEDHLGNRLLTETKVPGETAWLPAISSLELQAVINGG